MSDGREGKRQKQELGSLLVRVGSRAFVFEREALEACQQAGSVAMRQRRSPVLERTWGTSSMSELERLRAMHLSSFHVPSSRSLSSCGEKSVSCIERDFGRSGT